MDSTRQRRKYAPRLTREERRAQALDAALEVLGGRALHELSMEAVAAAAGVAKPVLYTAFSTRAELVEALLERERERGIAEVRAAMPDDLSTLGPTGAYTATIGAFLKAVLNNPTGWRLILTVPDSAPRDYRDSLRSARSAVLRQSEELARAAAAFMPQLARLDPVLLGHTMLSFAEMLGRLTARDPQTYPRERLEDFVATMLSMVADEAPQPSPGSDPTSAPRSRR